MSENVKWPNMVVAGGELRRLIERAGKLQAAQSAAKNKYDKCRKELDKLLEQQIEDDVPAFAKTYWAIRSHDKYEKIDPVGLLEEVTSDSLRRKVLVVPIGVARQELGEQKYFAKLVEEKTDEETTLHVNKIKKEGGD
jgi:hypothetical protein